MRQLLMAAALVLVVPSLASADLVTFQWDLTSADNGDNNLTQLTFTETFVHDGEVITAVLTANGFVEDSGGRSAANLRPS